MKAFKIVAICILTYTICHATIAWIGGDRTFLIHDVTFSYFSLVAGLLIGAVGVFLGTIGNLYSLIAKDKNISVNDRCEIVGFISAAVREVKHDVLFTITSLAVVVALQFFKAVDIPGIRWPLSFNLATKAIVSDAIAVCLATLALFAIFDYIRVMFLLHRHYEKFAENMIRKE